MDSLCFFNQFFVATKIKLTRKNKYHFSYMGILFYFSCCRNFYSGMMDFVLVVCWKFSVVGQLAMLILGTYFVNIIVKLLSFYSTIKLVHNILFHQESQELHQQTSYTIPSKNNKNKLFVESPEDVASSFTEKQFVKP